MTDGSDVVAVLSEARAAAVDAGWTIEYDHADGYFVGQKTTDDLRFEVSGGQQTYGLAPGETQIYLILQAYPA